MAKIILTSRYLRNASEEKLRNYVRYIGTREGVERIPAENKKNPASARQKQLVKQIIRDFPNSKEMLEYEDYQKNPTIENASEFITQALEMVRDDIAGKDNYIDYLAYRPGAERVGMHGLFSDEGKEVILSNVQKEVCEHEGPVWTHVISLRREDAERLGYNSAKEWMALIRSKRAALSKAMKIDSQDLRWYAAFHNESHHPHVHLMVYSSKDNGGYLSNAGIEALRSEFSHAIFRQDYANIYAGQNQTRDALKVAVAQKLQDEINHVKAALEENRTSEYGKISRKILELSNALQSVKGKKSYGYLNRSLKSLVDSIITEMAQIPEIKEAYQAWWKWQNEIYKMYSSGEKDIPPLATQKTFKSLKNRIISEAGKMEFSVNMPSEKEVEVENAVEKTEDIDADIFEYRSTERKWQKSKLWTERYTEARTFLYGTKKVERNLEVAYSLLKREAQSGNPLAMYDLGKMWKNGLCQNADLEKAELWYKKAFERFLQLEKTEEKNTYIHYRLGKMLAAGEGTERDYVMAAHWLDKASLKHHKYAEYTLAGLYYKGQGVEQNYIMAHELYSESAEQGNPYAEYELGKMYAKGIGCTESESDSRTHFERAFAGFCSLEEENHDDKLQYRIGQMLYTGTGTPKDEGAAERYWKKSAELGNVDAQCALAKLWLENRSQPIEKIIGMLEKAVSADHAAAQYTLGKIYAGDYGIPKNVQKAIVLFQRAAEQKNDYAAYRLGKIYLQGEAGISRNMEEGMRWLEEAAQNNNSYAQYLLGKIYLYGLYEVKQDREKATRYLQESSAQGNSYAQKLLAQMDLPYWGDPFRIVLALLRYLAELMEQDYRKASGGVGMNIDRRQLAKEREKKVALGHRPDDKVPVQKEG